MLPFTDERAHQRLLARVGAKDLGDVEGGEHRVHMFERLELGLPRAVQRRQGWRRGAVQIVEGGVGGRGAVVRCVEPHALIPVAFSVVCGVAAVPVVSVTMVAIIVGHVRPRLLVAKGRFSGIWPDVKNSSKTGSTITFRRKPWTYVTVTRPRMSH